MRVAVDVALPMALCAKFLPVVLVLPFLPVILLATCVPMLRLTDVMAAPAAAVNIFEPIPFVRLRLFSLDSFEESASRSSFSVAA